MKNHYLIKQTVENVKKKRQVKKKESNQLEWWQLTLIGIGSIIGAGFFLGTGLSIKTAGPSILFAYIIGGIISFLVFTALAEMSVNDPQTGSFRTYADKALGDTFGFLSGWVYWVSGVLIMSSEITALAIFTQFWFPYIPLWVFAILYSLLGFAINLLGTKNFGEIESFFAVVKISTLIGFILFSILLVFHIIYPSSDPSTIHSVGKSIIDFFPNGFIGFWSALIFVFFSFGGIAVIGVVSNELKDKSETPKAGITMLIILTAIYVSALYFTFKLVSWNKINESESPFVTALSAFHIPYLDSIFNVIIISAAFSTMVGALYSITNVMVSLANDGDAPKRLANHNQRGVPVKALLLSAIGLGISIFLSYFLPNTVYEYLTTAAGVLLIVNWVIILASHLKLHPTYHQNRTFRMPGYPYTSFIAIGIIIFTIAGAFFHQTERIGVFVSLGFIITITISYIIKRLIQKRRG